ncbi:MAG: hypothetical protein KGH72_01175 [Candidatus Micrarchaeota archaeon]|nr:hypothetical protein [Candidatus Micrarchaeota archaeon]
MITNSAKKAKNLKKLLEIIAYASIIIDICISVVTLISLKIGREYTAGIISLLGYVLTGIVISTIVSIAISTLSRCYGLSGKLMPINRAPGRIGILWT